MTHQWKVAGSRSGSLVPKGTAIFEDVCVRIFNWFPTDQALECSWLISNPNQEVTKMLAKKKRNCFRYSVVYLSFLLMAPVAHSATLYVNQAARTTGMDCVKKEPCATIEDAMNAATKGSRVIVYPGWYQENVLISEDNIKLESLTGPRNTFIAYDGADIINVTGENAAIGKKGKGFGIWADPESSTNSTIGVFFSSEKIKIEGNHFWGIDFDYATDHASFAIQGSNANKATIKGNWMEGWLGGINWFSNGKAKNLIQENEMYRMQGDCIFVDHFGGGSTKIVKNNLNACRDVEGGSRSGSASGITVNFFGTPGKATVADNVVQRTPVGYVLNGGVAVFQRNQHVIGRETFLLSNTDKSQVKDNLTQFVEQAVLLANDVTNATVSGNFFNTNQILTHDRPDTSSIKAFTKNEIVRRASGPGELCAIYALSNDYSADPIELAGNHWGGFDGDGDGEPNLSTDPACTGSTQDMAYQAGTILFPKPATTNVVPKFKDRSPL